MLVSVVIPTYNRARTIKRAVDSVLAQSWKPIEIIVVDDGSTDETAQLLEDYRDKIRVIHQENRGASAARNTGIKASNGEIISFLDSDDTWLPEKTERQAKLLQKTQPYGVTCCVCNATMLFSKGTVTSFAAAGLSPELSEGLWVNPAEVLATRFLFFNQVVAVRRDAIDQSGYFREDLKIMEDYDLELRLSITGPWAFITDPLVVWHEDAGNGLSRNLDEADLCRRTFEILNNWREAAPLKGSADDLLSSRIRKLKRKTDALSMLSDVRRLRVLAGKARLAGLRFEDRLARIIWPASQMITRPITGKETG
jgi:glycosyltransferase involved in cell wall biosynthesis